MKQSTFLIGIFTAIMSLCFAFALNAGTKFEENISLNEPSYKHKKAIVQFTHKKHVSNYKVTCGDCHHDKAGKPLKPKHGDNIDRCVKCHSKPGEIKGKKAKGMSGAEKRAYHTNALHDKCRGCHKAHNKKTNTKKAPTGCGKCHKK